MNQKKLFIKTYGCQMNIYDSNRMLDILKPLGYTAIETADDADIVILNTCHIREKAEEKVYSDLGRIKPFKEKKNAEGGQMLIGVAGCTAQAVGDELLKQAPYIDMIFGPQTYHRLPEMIAKLTRLKAKNRKATILDVDFPTEAKFDLLPNPTPTNMNGSSALVSIQEGCDKFCTFCVVPYTRGAEYSRSVDQILNEIEQFAEMGVQEVTLLGQNVNAYHGADSKGQEWNLGRLIFKIAEKSEIKRIRYMTSHPNDMHEELYEAHQSVGKLMPFLHLPIQSGSDALLKSMNRKHTRDDYFKMIDRLRHLRPDLAVSSDFIVGFPGETDKDFQDTIDLINQVNFAQAYSFKYSIRPGTPAGLMETQIPEEIKAERLSYLQSILLKQQMDFNLSFVGKELDVLFERDGKHEGQILGKSPYLQSVFVKGAERLKGHILKTKITQANQNGLAGELVLVHD